MTRMWRTTKLLALSMMTHTAEAFEVTDPAICYILDAFLLLYGIVFTALYFREKFSRSPPNDQGENKDTQEAVGAQSNPESGAVQRQGHAADDHYAALQPRTADTYSHIEKRKKRTKDAQVKKNEDYESLNQVTADTYNTLEMRPLPPRNRPN
ncbi:T-cell surface glycoprotein CD3 zeta chain-like isoform X2 [Clupea harengus]|uniref:T-cell surface glycoprotein CD3 zeta chain n=1 Tax=Clupea harengus TaxID=7950 RepID=A0A6P8ERC1_CLUHA|nr:T-cell surface glycoprotein CD3 zeta chain-like isoform X2 [Clupea harengus]